MLQNKYLHIRNKVVSLLIEYYFFYSRETKFYAITYHFMSTSEYNVEKIDLYEFVTLKDTFIKQSYKTISLYAFSTENIPW